MLSVQKTRQKNENVDSFSWPLKNLEKNFEESLLIENPFESISHWVDPIPVHTVQGPPFPGFGGCKNEIRTHLPRVLDEVQAEARQTLRGQKAGSTFAWHFICQICQLNKRQHQSSWVRAFKQTVKMQKDIT